MKTSKREISHLFFPGSRKETSPVASKTSFICLKIQGHVPPLLFTTVDPLAEDSSLEREVS
jgi:hypothetical protein